MAASTPTTTEFGHPLRKFKVGPVFCLFCTLKNCLKLIYLDSTARLPWRAIGWKDITNYSIHVRYF